MPPERVPQQRGPQLEAGEVAQGRRLLVSLAEELAWFRASAPWLPTPDSTGRDRERGTRAQGVLSYAERLERASGPAQRSAGLQGAKEHHSCVFHSPEYVSTSTTLLKLRHRALSDGGGGSRPRVGVTSSWHRPAV